MLVFPKCKNTIITGVRDQLDAVFGLLKSVLRKLKTTGERVLMWKKQEALTSLR
jgi:hypothetical protein